ncbi:hypothetical protein B296_00050394, partial [Ensete ventricosum]
GGEQYPSVTNGRRGAQQRRPCDHEMVSPRNDGPRHWRNQRNRVQADLTECLRKWAAEGFRVTGSVCDISSREQRDQLMREVSATFNGKLNILVLAAQQIVMVFICKTLVNKVLLSAAMNQMTKNLACEWAKDNIRINSVAPWYIKTKLVEHVCSSLPIHLKL